MKLKLLNIVKFSQKNRGGKPQISLISRIVTGETCPEPDEGMAIIFADFRPEICNLKSTI